MQFVLDKMEILSCLWFFNATKQSFKKYLFLILISHGFLWLYRCQTDNSYFFLNVCCLKFCFLAKKKNSLFFPHLNMLKYTQDLYWEKKKKSNKTSIRKKKKVILYRLNGFVLFYGMQTAASVSVHSCQQKLLQHQLMMALSTKTKDT